MYKKILVPTDGSDLSEQAAAAAIECARAWGSEIVAFSVVQPYLLLPVAEAAMTIDPGVESRVLQEAAQQYVDKVALAAKAAGVACTAGTTFSNTPHQEIINAAKMNKCDLIFMASHGRRGLSKLIAGSETQKVLAYSPVPVLVLRPPEHADTHAAN